jgi:Leucine-rich repeat (LRR) protein
MKKYLKYILIILLLVKQSVSIRCMNNCCECNELKDELKCTNNNNKESIDSILNEIIEIKSLDLSFNKLDNINIEIKSIIKLNLSNNRLLILKENQFSKLNKLEILDLSYNELFYIELNAFYGLNNVLQVLYLKN